MRDWVSLDEINMHWHRHLSDSHFASFPIDTYRKTKERWSEPPTQEQLDTLRQTLHEYLRYAARNMDREIINGILARPQFFEKARIVTDGSHLEIRIFAHCVGLWGNSVPKVAMQLGSCYSGPNMDEDYVKYVYYPQHSVDESLDWILENYEVIPFHCAPVLDLVDHMLMMDLLDS